MAAGLRLRLLGELGLTGAEGRWDAFAADLARAFAGQLHAAAAVPYAMVNVITDRQHFVGLHIPQGQEPVERTMSTQDGFCPEVAARGLGLVLPDVCAYPRFAANAVVDGLGIRTYAGAPLVHPATGIVLGTVCVVGTTPLPLSTGTASLELLKARSTALMDLIDQAADPFPDRDGC
ncbi:GAF domain-containing protein [Actinomadura graeca]|uniref:GAF domain-containing protein n=1 Tax=Actinomadura graeca TaxID=2750812 RepID=A0ABX8R7E0_9ACTN|nr:GAF domain-containing protein [Actinomadura graeca]